MVSLNVSFIVAISSLVLLVTFSEVRCVSLFLCMVFCGENIEKSVLVQTGTLKRYRFKSTDINLDSPAVIRGETLHGTLGVIYGLIAGNVDLHFLDNWRFHRDSWVDFQRKSSCTCDHRHVIVILFS